MGNGQRNWAYTLFQVHAQMQRKSWKDLLLPNVNTWFLEEKYVQKQVYLISKVTSVSVIRKLTLISKNLHIHPSILNRLEEIKLQIHSTVQKKETFGSTQMMVSIQQKTTPNKDLWSNGISQKRGLWKYRLGTLYKTPQHF